MSKLWKNFIRIGLKLWETFTGMDKIRRFFPENFLFGSFTFVSVSSVLIFEFSSNRILIDKNCRVMEYSQDYSGSKS